MKKKLYIYIWFYIEENQYNQFKPILVYKFLGYHYLSFKSFLKITRFINKFNALNLVWFMIYLSIDKIANTLSLVWFTIYLPIDKIAKIWLYAKKITSQVT